MYILEGALFHDVISICDPSFKTRIEFNDLVTLLCKQICSGLATFPASTVDGDGSVAWYGGKCFLNKVWLQDIDVDGIGNMSFSKFLCSMHIETYYGRISNDALVCFH